jgi:hypothetical protein
MKFELQHAGPDGSQHEFPAACVMAQQYYSPHFSHCSFFIARRISAPFLKMLLFRFFTFLNNCLNLKSRNLEMLKPGSVCATLRR